MGKLTDRGTEVSEVGGLSIVIPFYTNWGHCSLCRAKREQYKSFMLPGQKLYTARLRQKRYKMAMIGSHSIRFNLQGGPPGQSWVGWIMILVVVKLEEIRVRPIIGISDRPIIGQYAIGNKPFISVNRPISLYRPTTTFIGILGQYWQIICKISQILFILYAKHFGQYKHISADKS